MTLTFPENYVLMWNAGRTLKVYLQAIRCLQNCDKILPEHNFSDYFPYFNFSKLYENILINLTNAVSFCPFNFPTVAGFYEY